MISPDDYAFISDLLKKQSGLALGPGKEYLLESRLPSVAVTYGYDDIGALMKALRAMPSKPLVKHVCDAMTTNETMFFRDGKPFVTLEKELLPAAAKRAKALGRPVRLWCAASSTGQEPYTIAMIVAQMEAQLGGARVEIIATDYSSAALARAKAGIYNQFEVQRGLPVQLLMKYFKPHPEGFELSADIRNRVTYQEINLLDPFPVSWQFDIIFCRNVLIYFDAATKTQVLANIANQLQPDGYVYLGGAETVLGLTTRLVPSAGERGAYELMRTAAKAS